MVWTLRPWCRQPTPSLRTMLRCRPSGRTPKSASVNWKQPRIDGKRSWTKRP
ncbi:AAA domain protein, partial [Brucella grignonensis]